MAFNLNYWPLANDHTGKNVDLSFACCHCSLAIKANRSWQQELLDQKPVCMIKGILLAAAIFWDPNFVFCTRRTLKLIKKLGFKTKNIKNNLVKE